MTLRRIAGLCSVSPLIAYKICGSVPRSLTERPVVVAANSGDWAMNTLEAVEAAAPDNPIDLVEELVMGQDWSYDRAGSDEMVLEIPGRFSDYRAFLMWNDDVQALHLSVAFEVKVPPAKRRETHDLLALVNERLWLGHFDVTAEDGMPMFRHTLPLRGQKRASPEQIEDLIDTAIAECERFYPAFQFVLWGGRSAAEAIAAALIDVRGEA